MNSLGTCRDSPNGGFLKCTADFCHLLRLKAAACTAVLKRAKAIFLTEAFSRATVLRRHLTVSHTPTARSTNGPHTHHGARWTQSLELLRLHHKVTHSRTPHTHTQTATWREMSLNIQHKELSLGISELNHSLPIDKSDFFSPFRQSRKDQFCVKKNQRYDDGGGGEELQPNPKPTESNGAMRLVNWGGFGCSVLHHQTSKDVCSFPCKSPFFWVGIPGGAVWSLLPLLIGLSRSSVNTCKCDCTQRSRNHVVVPFWNGKLPSLTLILRLFFLPPSPDVSRLGWFASALVVLSGVLLSPSVYLAWWRPSCAHFGSTLNLQVRMKDTD